MCLMLLPAGIYTEGTRGSLFVICWSVVEQKGEDGERYLKLALNLDFLPSDLCSRARTGSSCALQFTFFTDKIIFKHCLLLNRRTKRVCIFFFPLGSRGGSGG